MTEIATGYDSVDREKCDYCQEMIEPDESRIVCGTGNSLIATYHLRCYEEMIVPPRRS